MDPQIGLAGMRIAIFLIMVAGGLLFFLEPGTAEFSITVVTLGIGVIFAGIVIAFVRIVGR
ncbi:MAG: hypothetical protein U0841_19160 [Chloroflexia bacterium]